MNRPSFNKHIFTIVIECDMHLMCPSLYIDYMASSISLDHLYSEQIFVNIMMKCDIVGCFHA